LSWWLARRTDIRDRLSALENTGAELALEAVAAGHNVWLSGRDVGKVPPFARIAIGRVFWFLATHVFPLGTLIGRRMHPSLRAGHERPLVRIRRKELISAGIKRVGRTTGSQNGKPMPAEGKVLEVASILWCTGFQLDFTWIHLPIFADDGYPLNDRGRISSQPVFIF
jgi:putative flavoprotein involved in K+ transport